jgi:hypothetical protein
MKIITVILSHTWKYMYYWALGIVPETLGVTLL